MNKSQFSKIGSRMGRSRIDEKQLLEEQRNREIVEEERNFTDHAFSFNLETLPNPIQVILSEFRGENLSYSDYFEEAGLLFLATIELYDHSIRPGSIGEKVDNIIKIGRKQDLKIFRKRLMVKAGKLKALRLNYEFDFPKSRVMMQKIGQVFGSIVLRDAMVTKTGFSQANNTNEKLTKQNLFQDQNLFYETKEENQIQMKNMTPKMEKDWRFSLKWPDSKDYASMKVRIVFETILSKRVRALYFSDVSEAKKVMSYAVVVKLTNKDTGIKSKINILKRIWKMKQAEYWYKTFVRQFFSSQKWRNYLPIEAQTFKTDVQDYFKANFPNIYQSNLMQKQAYDFGDNTYTAARISKNKKQCIDLGLKETLEMATLVDNQQIVEEAIKDYSNRQSVNLPFEKNEIFFPEELDLETQIINFSNRNKPKYLQKVFPELFDIFLKNSKILVKLKKFLVRNSEPMNSVGSDFYFKELELRMFIEKGDEKSAGASMLLDRDGVYNVYGFENVLKVDSNTIKFVRVEIKDKEEDEIIYSKMLNLGQFVFEYNLFCYISLDVDIKFNGRTKKGILFFQMCMYPRNLEISHLVLPNAFLDKNFDRLNGLLPKMKSGEKDMSGIITEEYVKAMMAVPNTKNNFNYHLKNFLPLETIELEREENLYAVNCCLEGTYDFFELLRSVKNGEYVFSDFFLSVADFFEKDVLKSPLPFLPLFSKITGLLSVNERFFIEKYLYLIKFEEYLPWDFVLNRLDFDLSFVNDLISTANEKAKSKPNWDLKSKTEYFALCLQLYFTFTNIEKDSRQYEIQMMEHFYEVIDKTHELNSPFLPSTDLLGVCRSRIFKGINLKNYSDLNHIGNVNLMIVYMKFIFKKMYPDEYSVYVPLNSFLDSVYFQLLSNSFVSFLNTVNYNIYSDFKTVVELILYLQREQHPHYNNLQHFDFELSSLIDILMLLNILVSNFTIFIESHQANFVQTKFENLLKHQNKIFTPNLYKILKLLDFVCESSFFTNEFEFFSNHLKLQQSQKVVSFLKIANLMRKEGFIESKVTDLIKNAFIPSPEFVKKSRYLFPFKILPDLKNIPISNSILKTPNRSTFSNIAFQDVFFDILEDLNPETTQDNKPEDHGVDTQILLEVFIYNLNYSLVDSLIHKKKLTSDINSIFEINIQEFEKFAKKYFQIEVSQARQLFSDFLFLSESDKFSLFKFVSFLLILTAIEKPLSFFNQCDLLVSKITQIFFQEDQNKHFNRVIHSLFQNFKSIFPMTFIQYDLNSMIDVQFYNETTQINRALMDLSGNLVDVTHICNVHFKTYFYITGKPGILFSRDFSTDLLALLSDFLKSGIINRSLKQFTMILQAKVEQKKYSKKVLFRVDLSSSILVLSECIDAIEFENEIDESNLISPQVLKKTLKTLPILLFKYQNSKKKSLSKLKEKKVVFQFRAKSLKMFTVETSFSGRLNSDVRFNIHPWDFSNLTEEKKLWKKDVFSFDLPIVLVFIPLGEMVHFVKNKLIEYLDAEDVLQFFTRNSVNQDIVSGKNKIISPKSSLYEVGDFNDFLINAEKEFTIGVLFE